MLDTIPGPLRDRMEIISLAGYTAEEKLEIARRYLVQRQLEANGLQAGAGRDRRRGASRDIIQRYTREAGVRSLEREIGQALRHAAVRIAEGQSGPIRIGARRSRRHSRRAAVRERDRRCARACPAWRPASPGRRSAATSCSSRRRAFPGTGKLILTGQLGDVMKESAQAALSLVKNRAAALGIDAGPLREERHPHPRAGRRHPEGRAERRRRDVHGARLAADRPDGPQRYGDDRRDQPARPGAAGRRHQGKGRRRALGRPQARHAAGAQPAGTSTTFRRSRAATSNSSGSSASTRRSPRRSSRRSRPRTPRRRSRSLPAPRRDRRSARISRLARDNL